MSGLVFDLTTAAVSWIKGRKHKTPGPETNNFVIQGTASSMSINIVASVPLAPNSHGNNVEKTDFLLSHHAMYSLPPGYRYELRERHHVTNVGNLGFCATSSGKLPCSPGLLWPDL